MVDDISVIRGQPVALLDKSRQVAAVATAFMLPISTSGMAIAMAALVALILLLAKANDWRAVLRDPVAVAPLALFALLLVSASWSPQPLGPGGISHYAKLLLIPLLMAGRFTREQAATIAYGFLAGCLILLALSFTAL